MIFTSNSVIIGGLIEINATKEKKKRQTIPKYNKKNHKSKTTDIAIAQKINKNPKFKKTNKYTKPCKEN